MEVGSPAKTPCLQQGRGHLRAFTLEHANATLPFVKRVVADIVSQHRKVSSLEERCHFRRPSVPVETHERTRRAYQSELERLRELVDELAGVGCRIRDWRRGVVDYRSRLEGRTVELCWWLGQDRIEYWHEVDESIPGRLIIDEQFCVTSDDP